MTTKCYTIVKDIIDGIKSQPNRIMLSFLAIAIGISSLTVLCGILNGLHEKSRRIITDFGVNVIAVIQQDTEPNLSRNNHLSQKHISYLKANLSDCLVAGTRRYNVSTLGTDQKLTVLAVDHNIRQIRQWHMYSGRFLDENDIRNMERNAVISKRLSEQWNWNPGDIIILHNTPVNIIGIIETDSGSMETEVNDPNLIIGEYVVFVPNSLRPDWLDQIQKPDQHLDSIFIKVPESKNITDIVSKTQHLFLSPDYKVNNISWIIPETLLKNVKKLETTISITIGSIVFLCLILGGTTLMSLMIADIRNRIPEIGLRRALGATSHDIVILFIVEACAVTFCSGLTGIITARLLLIILVEKIPVPVSYNYIDFLIPLITAVGLGIIFSYWPAKMASKIAPSEALRTV